MATLAYSLLALLLLAWNEPPVLAPKKPLAPTLLCWLV
ncbi:hypothetical protein J2X09_000516 [Hydrogenophaga laconesensis]|uniref:Uncharacterized protein n=1 Tax=Hydrogenophaga laconesensis TaxID=1805971 RepID=A0ABU1V5R0_9BURK|nr:hypothetical protein [Hydrogenophaga laconesensis]